MAALCSRLNPYLLILPSFLLTAFIIAYPLWDLLAVATHDVNRFGQLRGFIGMGNWRAVFTDALFYASLSRTALWTLGVVGGTLLLSIPIALILNDDFIGRGLMRVIIMLPWSVSLTMTAIVWRWGLHGQFGMLNAVLERAGIIHEPVVWLATARTAFPAQIAIGILVSIPFTVTVFLGGLASIPAELYEAAKVDGANAWQQFRAITLPLLKPFINIALVLNIIYVFNSFPIIWVLTEGGPANSTDILVTYLYKLAFRFGKMGEAAAVSLIMFALLLAFTLLYMRMMMRDDQTS
ncbi:MAG: sugar ABC transporter permease [Gammaproteobacteria bacterium]